MHALKKNLNMIGRLQKRSDFLRASHDGKKWISKSLILQTVSNDLDKPRFGITVTRKVSKKAVTRNRIKRRLRAACYDVMADKKPVASDFVLIGRAATENMPYETIVKDLRWCLKRLDCLQNDEKASS